MIQSQLVGKVLIVEKDGKVYMNSIEVKATFKATVEFLTTMHSEAYKNGFDIGKKVGRSNP